MTSDIKNILQSFCDKRGYDLIPNYEPVNSHKTCFAILAHARHISVIRDFLDDLGLKYRITGWIDKFLVYIPEIS